MKFEQSKIPFRSLIRAFLLVTALFVTPISADTCELPAQYKVPHKTFIINEKLSCESNIFINAVPVIAAKAEQKISPEAKTNSQAVGRLAYVLFGEEFAKNKPPVPAKDFTIPGKDGKHAIPVRFYEGARKGKVILFTHGGGWSRGNLETHDTLCRKVCEATGASVLAVDYRLAPEHPYPAALEDAEDAYHYLVAEHGKDSKIYVAGDSGGGNIAASLTLKLIKDNKQIPEGAILIYPALDLRIPEKTMDPYATGYLLTRDSINTYVHNYLGDDYEQANNPLVSPLLAPNEQLAKFPKTIIVNAECDPLATEGNSFVEKLSSLGIRVNHKVIPRTIHIFAQYFDLFPEAQEALDYIKDVFGKYS